jgi:hypothetical protein
VLALALALSFAAPAATDASWQAPAECPDLAAVQARIRAIAGRVPGDEELRVRARVSGPPWVVRLELARDGVAHERTIAASSCDAVADVVAVVVAVALDPVRVATRVDVAAAPTPVALPSSSPPRAAVDATAPPDATTAAVSPVAARKPVTRAVPMRLSLRVAAGGEVGATPRGTGGVELALAFTRGRFALELQGRYWIRRTTDVANGASLRTELGTVGLRGCWVGAVTRVRLSACGGLETGDFVARAFEVRGARDDVHFPWLAVTLGGGLAITIVEPVSFWLGIDGAAHVLRPQAVLDTDPATVLYEVAPVSLRVLGGLELRLFGRGR